MRFTRIEVRRWRNFSGVTLDLRAAGGLVCLVGENGSGKTSLFELIGAIAHRIGLTPGTDAPRGDPFADEHDVGAELEVGRLELLAPLLESHGAVGEKWDGSIRIQSQRTGGGVSAKLSAGPDHDDPAAVSLASQVVNTLRTSESILYLSLDSDRSYPHVGFDVNQFAQEITRVDVTAYQKQRSYARSSTMYGEWQRFALATVNRAATAFYDRARLAQDSGQAAPRFEDAFASYRSGISSVLPHLRFVGVNADNTGLLFDSSGVELTFSQLSGGEREIAFIIGQIERFRLKSGLMLLDEPELHLNPDLVRNWVSFLRDNVENGQVWIATHSMEAAEAAGIDSTFVLSRSTTTRTVDLAFPLSSQPVFSALSAALGTPGFSIQRLTFIYVEGERNAGEAQRYYDLFDDSRFVRFIEAGNAREVHRSLAVLKNLATDKDERIYAAGIIDADFRSAEERDRYRQAGLFVIPCHEIENIYLEPDTIGALAKMFNCPGGAPELIMRASDSHAGRWVVQRALYMLDYDSELEREARVRRSKTWTDIAADPTSFAKDCASLMQTAKHPTTELTARILESIQCYSDIRQSSDLWRNCFGKETLPIVASALGLNSGGALQSATKALWKKGDVAVPAPLSELRSYIQGSLQR